MENSDNAEVLVKKSDPRDQAKKNIPKRKLVTFSLVCQELDLDKEAAVSVAGDFNGWKPEKMSYKDEKQAFILRKFLHCGIYQYKFVVNGEWQVDPSNMDFVHNEHGTVNSLLHVKKN